MNFPSLWYRIHHSDLSNSSIKRDEFDIASLMDLLENNWTNPFQPSSTELVHLSTGLTAPPEVSADLLSVQQKGEEAFKEYQQQRLQTGVGFYDGMKKLKLKTFGSVRVKSFRNKDKEMVLRADRKVFGNMMLIAMNRDLDMRHVFSHPLGSFPWSLI